jgi:hypothetical protein
MGIATSKKLLALAAVASLTGVVVGAPATAATTQKAGMTCEQFLTFDVATRPKVVYWVEGVKEQGKWHDAVIDTVSTDQIIPVVTDQCQAAPKASLWQTVDNAWHTFELTFRRHL